LTVVFTAKSGASKTIVVPADLVRMQLEAVEAARAALPKATASAAPR
jgi:hypothetical protein